MVLCIKCFGAPLFVRASDTLPEPSCHLTLEISFFMSICLILPISQLVLSLDF